MVVRILVVMLSRGYPECAYIAMICGTYFENWVDDRSLASPDITMYLPSTKYTPILPTAPII